MNFVSLTFGVFLLVVFLVYWAIPKQSFRLQNTLVLIASFVFYGFWDWRFLGLIVMSSVVDYFVALQAEKSNSTKKWLMVSLAVNLGTLGLFKYFDFFVGSLSEFAQFVGLDLNIRMLHLILPVGISFYTFQTLSYTIDVCRGKLKATKDFWAFMAYVSFFPQLVAGPIERASALLPQFLKPRDFDLELAYQGMQDILWGLFKKVVIADQCAILVNQIFASQDSSPTYMLVLAIVFFAFQIYGDFSGYSDIAIGTSKLFGFRLSRNFAYPYFARDIAEYWRRWHISLSTWFRDYLYIPLGGSRTTKAKAVRNVIIVFVVSGVWHGANMTFVVWGFLHAMLFVPGLLRGTNRRFVDTIAKGRRFPSGRECLQMFITFTWVGVGWILFRSETLGDAFHYSVLLLTDPFEFKMPTLAVLNMVCLVAAFVWVEWISREVTNPFHLLGKSRKLRWVSALGCMLWILVGGGNNDAFIYFQF